MEIVITLQTLCVASLALGTTLSMYQLMQRRKVTDRITYAVANEFETGYRRMVRNRRR
jgi:hypothetical protein